MESLDEAESAAIGERLSRLRKNGMIVPKKRRKYMKDSGYSDAVNTESVVPDPETDPPANCIPHLSEAQHYIKELSNSPTADSPQDSGESAIQAKQPESSNGDSIADASQTSTPESFYCSASLDSKRTRRTSKRKKEVDECCPVCGITVRFPELESHLAQEIEKLSNISRRYRKSSQNGNGISTTYVQVKSNRENRLSAQVALYAAKAQKEVQCPICKLRLTGSVEEVNDHVELCLHTDDQVVVDDDDDSSYEEYEIGDETRIRAISMIRGGYQSLQGQSVNRTHDEDIDVEVDVDDTIAYGQPQYTELDVISDRTQGMDEAHEQLRKAVLNDPTAQPQVLESRKWCENAGEEENKVIESRADELNSKPGENDDCVTEDKKNTPIDQIISSLRERMKDLADQNKNVKCLICLEPYTKPVVSTTCWHVHCEECWLMTMGMKKLCPQCNMIVFPSDLRKIYL